MMTLHEKVKLELSERLGREPTETEIEMEIKDMIGKGEEEIYNGDLKNS